MAIHNHATDLKDPAELITLLSTLELIALVSPLFPCEAARQEEERERKRANRNHDQTLGRPSNSIDRGS